MRVSFGVPFVAGKARPRVTRNGSYTPRATREREEAVWDAYCAACREAGMDGPASAPKGVPVSVSVCTRASLPKDRPLRVLSEPHTQKPDVDNVLKLVLDGLNPRRDRAGGRVLRQGAWADDSQVVEAYVLKFPRGRAHPAETCVTVEWGESL